MFNSTPVHEIPDTPYRVSKSVKVTPSVMHMVACRIAPGDSIESTLNASKAGWLPSSGMLISGANLHFTCHAVGARGDSNALRLLNVSKFDWSFSRSVNV